MEKRFKLHGKNYIVNVKNREDKIETRLGGKKNIAYTCGICTEKK